MWRVIPGQDLQQRSWDDEHVVYNNLSGDTHLLTAEAMQILLALRGGALDETALIATLRQQFEVDSDTDLAEAVATLLAELGKLSLIEQTAC